MTHPATRRSRSPFDTYLTEIDTTPLLTADEESTLAARIAAGDPGARDHLVRANLRLVVSLARRYARKGLDTEDLVAEGNLGLLRAAEGFDPAAGTRFATYAAFWVRQSMRRALSRDGATVRLPQYVVGLLANWARATADLNRELGRTPSEEEVAAQLGLTARQVRVVRKARRACAAGHAEDEGPAAVELLPDGRGGCPAESLGGAEETDKAVGLLDRLGAREAAILRMRFGLDGSDPVTLREAGEQLGYTRERVRQIENEALAKLRDVMAA